MSIPPGYQNLKTNIQSSSLGSATCCISCKIELSHQRISDKIFDNLSIVNFNYDRCIEQFLARAICELFRKSDAEIHPLMERLQIFHPYGQVGHMQWARNGLRKVGFGDVDYEDLIGVANEIRTFNEQIEEGEELKIIREKIASAQRIVFLGFHFHSQNMELLKATGPGRGGIVNSYATAYDRSEADKALLDRVIRKMLEERGGTWNVNIERAADCKKLFKDYGSTWLR